MKGLRIHFHFLHEEFSSEHVRRPEYSERKSTCAFNVTVTKNQTPALANVSCSLLFTRYSSKTRSTDFYNVPTKENWGIKAHLELSTKQMTCYWKEMALMLTPRSDLSDSNSNNSLMSLAVSDCTDCEERGAQEAHLSLTSVSIL